MQRIFQHWIATKWLEIDQDNLRMKFWALNVDFSGLSLDRIIIPTRTRFQTTGLHSLATACWSIFISRIWHLK